MLLSQPRSPQSPLALTSRSNSIVFIDSTVENFQQLINGIYPEIEIKVLNRTEDGMTQISQILQQYRNLKTLHLVSHGSPGCLYLGNTELSLATLGQYKSSLRKWKKAFAAESPAILLYGCEVAALEAGRVFIKKLRQLTGIDIAASAKLTGNKALGGDWELEVRTGKIEVPLAFSEEVREAYAGILATYTVNTLVDENDGIEDGEISLREAIEAGNSSEGADTIEFESSLSGGTITLLNGELEITDALTIDGLGAENLTISGDNNSRVFNVDDTDATNEIEVAIEGLTITNGSNDNGGGIYNQENLTVTNSTISGNSAEDGNGGGIFNDGTLIISDSDISGNSTSSNESYKGGSEGGGIYNSGNLTVTNSTISNNNVSSRNRYSTKSYVTSQGGGIANSGSLTLTNSIISGNQVTSSSIAYYLGNASSQGGGISNSGSLTLTNSTISGNQVTSSSIAYYIGNASSQGGGISNSGTIILTNSTISGNNAFSNSSHTYYFGFSNADNQGGGINNSGTITIINSTISSNQASSSNADSQGGGINNYGTLAIANSTITQNNAITGGGIRSIERASASQVSNSIIAGNLNSDVSGTFSSLGYNLIGTGDITNFNQTGDMTRVSDPSLDALANNGGPTPTHALLPNSPAINAGNNVLLPLDTTDLDGDGNTNEPLPIDQRGEPRIQGGTVDIGAVESNFTGVPLPTVNLTLSNSITLEGKNSVVYNLSRTGSLDSALTIQLSAAGSEGLTPDDFNLTGVTGTFPNFTVTFAAGESQAEFTLSAVEDSTLEIGENFTLNLAENAAYRIDSVNNSSTVTILNPNILLVNNTNDSGLGSLRQAILDANTLAGANTIVFAESLSGQTITLTSGALGINDDLTIDGLGAENLTISGNNNSRIFSISYEQVEIEGLTLTDGNSSDGGAIFNQGDLTLRNSIITGNTASSRGGGIYNWGSVGLVQLYSSRYYLPSTSSLTVISSVIADNTADSGGGIFNQFGDVILNDSTLFDNTANSRGGAIDNQGVFAIDRGRSSFEKLHDLGNLSVSNSNITGNTAGSEGGGIFNITSDVQVIDSIISGNITGTDGGGLFSQSLFYRYPGYFYASGSVTLSNTTISNNQAGSNGGGIWGDFTGYTSLSLNNSTISGNQAGSDGGGIWGDFGTNIYNDLFLNSELSLSNSTISGNQAGSDGGGIWGSFGDFSDLEIANSTLSGNTADANGGGLFTSGTSSGGFYDDVSSITSSTITGNTANEGGGIFNNDNFSVSVGNTIIAANTDNKDIAGKPFNSLGYNLIGNGDGASGFDSTGDQVGTSSNPIDPLLGPLQNNGGPTETHALLEGSPAIDAGNPNLSFSDQRGVTRPQGQAPDIGAFESFLTSSFSLLSLSTTGTPKEAKTTPATITLVRQGSTSGELVVNFSLAGTATPEVDYTLSNVNLSNNTLTFADGQSSLDLILAPIEDNIIDPDETVQFNLLIGNGYELEMPNSASLTILDNDGRVINGTAQSETLTGTDFNDRFNGRGGEDTLTGGLGDDRYTVNSLGDVVVERANQGNDTVNSSVTYSLRAHIENLTLTGTANINGKGNSLDNILKGNAGNNQLQGLAGNDLITGGVGNDKLVGGAGDDTLTGGGGADQFLFTGKTYSSLGIDTLTDFAQGSDKLVLSPKIFSTLETVSGTIAQSELASIRVALDQEMAVAGTSSANLVYNSRSGNLFYNANGADEGFGEGGLLASLTRRPSTLEVTDFLVQAV